MFLEVSGDVCGELLQTCHGKNNTVKEWIDRIEL
jgi:hypothetical protein